MALRTTAPTEYNGLHKYLRDRFAVTVVLTFAEIEDLLGFALPAAARQDSGWWLEPPADGVLAPQSHAWIDANRTAVPNLTAHIVTFERTASAR